jgi:type III secretory pathway component EscV
MAENTPIWDRDLTEKVLIFLGAVLLIGILLWAGTPEVSTVAISTITAALGFMLEYWRRSSQSKRQVEELATMQKAIQEAMKVCEAEQNAEAYKILEASSKSELS